jgi:hypothetical protein
MAEVLAELVAKITADASEFKKALTESERDIQGLGKTTKTETKSIADNFKTLGKTMAIVGASITAVMTGIIFSFTKVGSELYDLSLKTGVSAKSLAGLKYAAEQSGASLGTVEMAIRRVAMAMSDAESDTSASAKAFDKVGLSLSELRGLKPEQQFLMIANAIAKVPDPMQRAAIAVDLFGRTGTDMLPMLADGADGLQKLIDKGIKLSGWTDEGAKSADDFGDAIATLKTAFVGLMNVLGNTLTKTLLPFITGLTEVISKVSDLSKKLPISTGIIGTFAVTLGVALTAFGGLALILPKIISFCGILGTSLGVLAGAITGLAGGIALMVYGFSQMAQLSSLSREISSFFETAREQGNLTIEDTTKLIGLLKQRNEIMKQGPLTTREKAFVAENEKLIASLESSVNAYNTLDKKIKDEHTIVLNKATDALEAAQKQYDDTKKAGEGFGSEIYDLDIKVRDANLELQKQQRTLKDVERAYNDATDAVDTAQQAVTDATKAISDANDELNGLASPRLEGMQEYEDQLFAIDQQIKELKLQQLYNPDDEYLKAQIAQLEVNREALQLQNDITFDPLIRSAKEAVETTQGLNDEMAPTDVMSRIAELSASLASGGELNQGLVTAQLNLVNAQTTLADITIKYNDQKTVVGEIETSIENWNISLTEMNNNLDDTLTKLQGIVDLRTQEKALIESNSNITSFDKGGATVTEPPAGTVPIEIEKQEASKNWFKYNFGSLYNLLASMGIIKEYASGGLVTRPTLAMVGESGPELITPVSELGQNNNQPIQNNLYLDGALFAQIVSAYQDREYRAQMT